MKSSRTTILLIALFCSSLSAQTSDSVQLNHGWKFRPGDNLDYAAPSFNDSQWVPIQVDRNWENQGYEKLDGFAWYRIKFLVPSRMKDIAYLKDGLRIFLGKINNFDQSFLNGKVFGINAQLVTADTPIDTAFTKADMSMWNVSRSYVLPCDDPRILWGKENVIAIRVFDEGGLGGLFTGDANIRMVDIKDYLAFDNGARPFVFKGNEVRKNFTMKNTSSDHSIKGTMTIKAENKLTRMELWRKVSEVELDPGKSKSYEVSVQGQDQSTIFRYGFDFSGTPETLSFQEEAPYILTPRSPEEPKINGAAVYGERPNKPFMFTIPTTGLRPMKFDALRLPAGLTLDQTTGIISGRVQQEGTHEVTLVARNKKGQAKKNLTIVIGNTVALTPPLGWNSWNCWGLTVDEDKVLASARVFKEKGLMDHGWTYINVDDGWEIKGNSSLAKRDDQGNIITNDKFRNMKALGDSIHALGLKFGIYSSPGTLTCGGYTGSYQYELNDASSFANWGIDYLKYDWCSYDKIAKDTTLTELKIPYVKMRGALIQVDRDIVYSLCQYGMGKVWKWGAGVGGNLWRTTEDITDTWESINDIGFNQVENAPYAGPGHWNDPDMLVVGWVGWGPSLHPSKLTADEQYTHISLWCMLSAPLLIGCDLTRLDDFTLNLLTNDEVLALDQDPLGKQAVPVVKEGNIQVWLKELADGGKAIGVFNLGLSSEKYRLDPSRLGFKASVAIRDVWRQKNLNSSRDRLNVDVPSHGVVLLKLKNL